MTEQLFLRGTDIGFKLGQIPVRDSKSDISRLVCINHVVVEEILRRLPRRINHPYVFVGRKLGDRFLDLPCDWRNFLVQAKIETPTGMT
jgi:hypothetical protein